MTLQERICKAIKRRGYIEISSRSRKYREFRKEGAPLGYFVGKCGALRRGRIASKTVSLTGTSFYKGLLKEEEV